MKFAMGGGSFKQTADTLATNDTVEVLLGLSEGPIAGPVNGPKSCYADLTPLVNPNGEPNFSAFQLDFWPGSPTGDQVAMLTGGFSSPTQVSQVLYSQVPLVRTGSQTGITAVDFNIVISNLMFENTKETNTETLKLLFEYCGADGAFKPCFTANQTASQETTALNSWSVAADQAIASFGGDRQVLSLPTVTGPAAAPNDLNAVAIDSSGNVYQWDTGSIAWVQAEMTSGTNGTYANWTDVEGNQNITRRVYKPSKNPPSNPRPNTGDVWDQGNSTYLIWNGSAWVTPAAYQSYAPTAQTLTDGVWSIVAKITTQTTITIRCFLPVSSTPYTYRVTKQVKDDTTTDFTDCSWDSFGEIKQSAYTFNSLAMLHVLGQASDQFTSLPNWGVDAEGRTVQVPSNYDPVARTYAGTWDGTYKVAYTNNPAWVFKDFVENTTYGLSSVYPHICNKWSLYTWSQFCDALVPTQEGGLQPRYTYNDYINQQRDARETANFIAGAAQAIMVDDGNGNVDVLIDDPSQAAIAVFTEENVGPDGFVYTYTDRLTRTNQVIVTFANPQVTYQTDKRIEQDLPDQAKIGGTITDQIVATGCTDPDEALRRARRRLVGSLTEKEIVSFTTNRKGKYLSEWDVILVADPAQGRGLSGRISSVIDSNTVQLRDPITLEPGFAYTATFDIVNPEYGSTDDDPYQTVVVGIATEAGTLTQLVFASALPALPEYAVFAIDCLEVIGSPKPYRITTIDDQDGSGESITITALELNRAKQDYIDGVTTQIVSADYSDLTSTYVGPPSDLQITSSVDLVGGVSTRTLTISWTLSGSNLISDYVVSHLVDDVVAETLHSNGADSVSTHNCNRGIHTFTVVAVNIAGRQSQPVTLMYDVVGSARSIPAPINITGSFNGANASILWNPPTTPDPNFSFYQVSIIDPVSEATVRNINVGSNISYTYLYATNVLDGTRRSIDVLVTAIDQDGNQSDGEIISLVNEVPTLTTATISATPYAISMAYSSPTDPDFAGIVVYMSDTAGIQGSVVWQKAGQPTIPASPGQTYYITYGFYDQFGLIGINLSAQTSILTPLVSAADIAALPDTTATSILQNITNINDSVETLLGALNDPTTGLPSVNAAVTAAAADADSGAIATLAGVIQDANERAGRISATTMDDGTPVRTITATSADAISLLGSVQNGIFILSDDTVETSSGQKVAQSIQEVLSAVEGTPTQPGLQSQITSLAQATTDTTNQSSLAYKLDQVEATINGVDGQPSLEAQITDLTTATTDTTNGESLASKLEAVTSTVDGTDSVPSLSAQILSLKTATTDTTNSSSLATELDAVTTTVNGINGQPGLSAQIASLKSATTDTTNGESLASLLSTVTATVGTSPNSDGTGGSGLQAQVYQAASAAATANGKLAARLVQGVQAGTGAATVTIESDGVSGLIKLVANALTLADVESGQEEDVLSVSNGVVAIMSKLLLGSNLVLDPTIPGLVAINGNTQAIFGEGYGANQNMLIWAGPSNITPAQASRANAYLCIDANGLFVIPQGTTATSSAVSVKGISVEGDTNKHAVYNFTLQVAAAGGVWQSTVRFGSGDQGQGQNFTCSPTGGVDFIWSLEELSTGIVLNSGTGQAGEVGGDPVSILSQTNTNGIVGCGSSGSVELVLYVTLLTANQSISNMGASIGVIWTP